MSLSLQLNEKKTVPAVYTGICLLCLSLFSGCAMVISSATSDMMENLSNTILNNDDLDLVEKGAPAYLLMIDSLTRQDPQNKETLTTAALLYAAYADVFVEAPERSRKMADKALKYAIQAICTDQNDACNIRDLPFEQFKTIITHIPKKDLPSLFALGNAWAGWIMANKYDFNAIADLARIELIMNQVTFLDETYKDGAAYLYLGTLSSLLPPALGGKPDLADRYFKKAIDISKGKNLMVKVMYAKLYARMTFNRPLHDQLLDEVLSENPNQEGYTLVNTYAQQQAAELKKSADDYFE